MANGNDVQDREGRREARLAELCRSHEIDEKAIALGEGIDGVVDQVLADLDSEIASIASATENARLHNLVAFLRNASTLRDESDEGDGTDRMDERFDNLALFCHKINNPLTTLLGRSQILQLKVGSDPKICKAVNVIQESAQRIARLVREMSQEVCDARDDLKASKRAPSSD